MKLQLKHLCWITVGSIYFILLWYTSGVLISRKLASTQIYDSQKLLLLKVIWCFFGFKSTPDCYLTEHRCVGVRSLTVWGGFLWHYQHVCWQSAETQRAPWIPLCCGTLLHLSDGDLWKQVIQEGEMIGTHRSTTAIVFSGVCGDDIGGREKSYMVSATFSISENFVSVHVIKAAAIICQKCLL